MDDRSFIDKVFEDSWLNPIDVFVIVMILYFAWQCFGNLFMYVGGLF